MNHKSLNTLSAAASKLGVTRKFLAATIEANLISTLRIGDREYISNSEIARFEASVAA